MRILVIEDEKKTAAFLAKGLREAGFVVDLALDGEAGLAEARASRFDLLIVDIMLPKKDGWALVEELRAAKVRTPVIFLTARDSVPDRVKGFEIGADDYVTKPFEAAELIARIDVLLRRVPIHTGQGIHEFGPIRVDVRRSEVTRDGKPVYLSAREFQLLRYLVERAGRTVPRKELLQSVWGYHVDSLTRTVDSHIGSLRVKLEENPKHPEFIVTVAGVGYKFMGSGRK